MRHRRQICYGSQMHPTIYRRRSVITSTSQKRQMSSSSSPSVDRVTWREALTSPRKAVRYLIQLCFDFWDWCKHMWTGSKLLAADVRVSSKILRRVTQGKQLTRRERNFIVQTGVDLARLVPFSLFLIIPLAELALPLALRFFPNMLPSQFQDQMKAEENMKKRLKARLQLAKYLREVVQEKAKLVQSSDANSEMKKTAEDLTEFLTAIQRGHPVSADKISRFAKFFNDELTIDGAARPQLVAMCKYMGISPYGHDVILQFKLRSRLSAIKKDDMQIMWEGGVDSLTDSEVAKACRDRGIREEVSNTLMRKELSEWLELAQKREIPGSLMIMSRAFTYGRTEEPKEGVAVSEEEEETESLKETLGSMPEDVIMDVKQAADRGSGLNVNLQRLEETLRQAKLIEIESERIQRKEKEDEEKRKKREEEEDEEQVQKLAEQTGSSPSTMTPQVVGDVQAEQQDADQQPPVIDASTVKPDASTVIDIGVPSTTISASTTSTTEKLSSEASAPVETKQQADSHVDSISDAEVMCQTEAHEATIREEMMAKKDIAEDEEEELKKKERIRAMLVSLGQLTCDSSVEAEREELRNLKLQLAEAEQNLQVDDNGRSGIEGVGMEMRRFKRMMRAIERDVERVDAKVGLRMKLLDQDNDGVMSLDEVRHAMTLLLGVGGGENGGDGAGKDENEALVQTTLQRLDADADGNISKADLTRLLNEMQFDYDLVDDIATKSGNSSDKTNAET